MTYLDNESYAAGTDNDHPEVMQYVVDHGSAFVSLRHVNPYEINVTQSSDTRCPKKIHRCRGVDTGGLGVLVP